MQYARCWKSTESVRTSVMCTMSVIGDCLLQWEPEECASGCIGNEWHSSHVACDTMKQQHAQAQEMKLLKIRVSSAAKILLRKNRHPWMAADCKANNFPSKNSMRCMRKGCSYYRELAFVMGQKHRMGKSMSARWIIVGKWGSNYQKCTLLACSVWWANNAGITARIDRCAVPGGDTWEAEPLKLRMTVPCPIVDLPLDALWNGQPSSKMTQWFNACRDDALQRTSLCLCARWNLNSDSWSCLRVYL